MSPAGRSSPAAAMPVGELPPGDTLDARKFLIAIRRLADSLSYGTDRSPFLGAGMEFVQSRPYQAGDPMKSIDWRVTARTGKLFVKEYEAPKRLPTYLAIDTSASMVISSIPSSKYARAIQIAGALALASLDRVSPVGCVGVGETPFVIEPSLSKDRVLQWLHRLRRYRWDERTWLGSRLAELGKQLSSRALLIVISDLHDPTALPILRRVAQEHDVCVIQLRDPAERELRGTGFLRIREAETGRTAIARAGAKWLDHELLKNELRRAGIDHLRLDTDQPIDNRLRRFFASRGGLGRGAR